MVIKQCNLCDISYTRKNIVNGSGNIYGDIMIVGESPGYYEDKLGFPFANESGKYLRTVLKNVGFHPSNIYFTNVIKCKPATPKPKVNEIRNCSVHLKAELNTMNPKMIILLGRTAYENFYSKTDDSMSKIIKRVTITKNGTYIVCAYHPAYIIANAAALDDYYYKLFSKYYNIYVKYINPNYKFKISLLNG